MEIKVTILNILMLMESEYTLFSVEGIENIQQL